MKRLAIAALLLILAGGLIFAGGEQEGAKKELTFAYMSGVLDPFMQMIEKGAQAKADELGVKLMTAEYPKKWGAEIQVPILEAMAAKGGFDFLLVVPTGQTALIAPLGTKVAAYVLIRLLFFVADPNLMRVETPLTTVIGLLGAAGLIWGSVLAVCQKELKRMLACSSIAQVGYIALGIGLSSPLGFIGAVLHALNHACMKACIDRGVNFFYHGSRRSAGGFHAARAERGVSFRRAFPITTRAAGGWRWVGGRRSSDLGVDLAGMGCASLWVG